MNGSFSFQSDLSGAADGTPIGAGGGDGGGGGGLGSLADELAGEWDDGEDEEEDGSDGVEDFEIGDEGYLQQAKDEGLESRTWTSQDPSRKPTRSDVLAPPEERRTNKHKRAESVYDGSDYGDDSDLEPSDGISPGLEAKMAQIESLVRRGAERNGGEQDDVIERVIAGLKDLGGQAGVETGATR